MTGPTTPESVEPDPADDDASVDAPEVPLLERPAGGIPVLCTDRTQLARLASALDDGTGPIALDAERAHGFRYSTRAYLIQIRRAGSGTHLLDPIPFRVGDAEADLSALTPSLQAEWILHAASQDLPCLAEVGLLPTTLFDTELAGRLLGYPRVALGTLIEELLGVRLRKEHSAADWSTRPLPEDWLSYAALDVELLVELRDVLADQLEAVGKTEWAAQEFAALVASAGDPPTERVDPWRRTSGLHAVRTPAGLNRVKFLWTERDRIARDQDRAPGRVLADRAIVAAALLPHAPGREDLRGIEGFNRRHPRRYESNWLQALTDAEATPRRELPPLHIPGEGPPAPRMWARRDPAAAARLQRVRDHLETLAEQLNTPAANLLTPDHLRRVAWQPPADLSPEGIDRAFAELGARPWQRELLAGPFARLLADDDADPAD